MKHTHLNFIFRFLVLLLLLAGVAGIGKKRLSKEPVPTHRPECDSRPPAYFTDSASPIPNVAPHDQAQSEYFPKIAKHAVGRPPGTSRRNRLEPAKRLSTERARKAGSRARARADASQVSRRPQLAQGAFLAAVSAPLLPRAGS